MILQESIKERVFKKWNRKKYQWRSWWLHVLFDRRNCTEACLVCILWWNNALERKSSISIWGDSAELVIGFLVSIVARQHEVSFGNRISQGNTCIFRSWKWSRIIRPLITGVYYAKEHNVLISFICTTGIGHCQVFRVVSLKTALICSTASKTDCLRLHESACVKQHAFCWLPRPLPRPRQCVHGLCQWAVCLTELPFRLSAFFYSGKYNSSSNVLDSEIGSVACNPVTSKCIRPFASSILK